jgi:hypothetical protein
VVAVAKERLLRGLANLLVDDAELEVVHQDMSATHKKLARFTVVMQVCRYQKLA